MCRGTFSDLGRPTTQPPRRGADGQLWPKWPKKRLSSDFSGVLYHSWWKFTSPSDVARTEKPRREPCLYTLQSGDSMDIMAWPVLAHFVRSWPFLSGPWPVLSDLSGSWPAHPHDRLKCNHPFLYTHDVSVTKFLFYPLLRFIFLSSVYSRTFFCHHFVLSCAKLVAGAVAFCRPGPTRRGLARRVALANCQITEYRIYPLFDIDKATYSRRAEFPENKLGGAAVSGRGTVGRRMVACRRHLLPVVPAKPAGTLPLQCNPRANRGRIVHKIP